MSQFLVILEEESEVLIGDVNVSVPTKLLVLLLSVPSTRECVLVDLFVGVIMILVQGKNYFSLCLLSDDNRWQPSGKDATYSMCYTGIANQTK